MKGFFARAGKITVASISLLLVYTVVGFLLFPVILRWAAATQLTQFFGRTVTIRKIDYNPYTLSMTVHGIQIDGPTGGTIFSLDALHATFAPWAMLTRHTWAFADIALEKPSVVIVRNENGVSNFADLLRLDWPKRVHLQAERVSLMHGEILFHDEAVPGGFSSTIIGLTATITGFSTSPDHTSTFSVSAVSEAGEKLSCHGTIRMNPLRSHGEIAVEGVQLARYSPYLEENFTFTIADGELTARMSFDVDLDRDRFTLMLYDGTIMSRSLTVNERESAAPVFGFAHLMLTGAQVDLAGRSIGIDSILITGGSAVLRRLADTSFNIQHLIRMARAPSVAEAEPPVKWNVAVREIRIADFNAEVRNVFGQESLAWKDLLISMARFRTSPPAASWTAARLQEGTLEFTDSSLSPPVTMALTHVDIRIGGFSSEEPQMASVAVDAEIDDSAHLQISGGTNPIGAQGETALRGLVRNVNLVPLSPYAAKYLGYELEAGELSIDLSFLMRGRTINAQTTLEIDRFAFGAKTGSKDAMELPVRLVIFLLTDSSGKITLNVPFERVLDNSNSEYQQTIIDAMLHPFWETTGFPFAVLAAASGSGNVELGVQEFSPGSAELSPRETGKLDAILQGLERWPELMLDIVGSVDAKTDTGDLLLLAIARAKTVKEYLLHGGTLDPGRIFLIRNTLENIPKEGSRALLSLKDRYRGLN